MLCNSDSEEVTTKYHLLKVKPSFGDDTSEATTSTDSTSGDQNPKRVEVKKEGRQSQGRARQSCDGARNAARENNQKRRAFFLTAGHMVTLNPQKMTDFAGTPIEGITLIKKRKTQFLILCPVCLSETLLAAVTVVKFSHTEWGTWVRGSFRMSVSRSVT